MVSVITLIRRTLENIQLGHLGRGSLHGEEVEAVFAHLLHDSGEMIVEHSRRYHGHHRAAARLHSSSPIVTPY